MNYRGLSYLRKNKNLLPALALVVLSCGFIFSSCSKKKSEEEITITLKTEGTTLSQPAVAPPPAQGEPSFPVKQGHEAVVKAKTGEEKPEHRVARAVQQHNENETANKATQVAVNVPPAVKGPSPEDIARQQVLAIIDRQKQAMVTKNVSLALEDIAGNNDQNKRTLEDYFNRYDKIDVTFSNISINVSGNTAIAVMDQKTSIVTKSVIPQTITELTKVQWTFVDGNNRWFISGTQILAKMKDR